MAGADPRLYVVPARPEDHQQALRSKCESTERGRLVMHHRTPARTLLRPQVICNSARTLGTLGTEKYLLRRQLLATEYDKQNESPLYELSKLAAGAYYYRRRGSPVTQAVGVFPVA